MATIVITGASTGIGYHTTREFINRGNKVYGSVRTQQDADRLKADFGDHFAPLIFDVTDGEAIRAAAARVASETGDKGIDILINNAGVVVTGPVMQIPIKEYQKQFDINVFGMIRVTQAFLPLLGVGQKRTSPPGRILNIGSAVGKLGFPFLSPYVASKHAVEGLSQSLRRELLQFGIDVIIIGPTAIKTPIWQKESATHTPDAYAKGPFGKAAENFQKMFLKEEEKGMEPAELARQIADIAVKSKPKTRYALSANKFREWIMPRILPDRTLDKMMKKVLMR